MTGLRLDPVDTWFFRSGTSFNKGSAPQENVGSVFPPFPPTVAGALRAALARRHGWNGRVPWPPPIRDVLGDGPDDLGLLSFNGPFLLQCGEPLFRVPRHVLGRTEGEGWSPRASLRPGGPVACDLNPVGGVRLPELAGSPKDPERLKTGDRHWLTRDGLNAVLRGLRPLGTEVRSNEQLWFEETRIGLERDGRSRTAKEGMLYSTRHIRPCRGIALGMRISGLPPDWDPPFDQLLPLGGESRLAECREWKGDVALDVPTDEIASAGRVAIVALSPMDLEPGIYRGSKPLETSFGKAAVVSACIGRPLRIGGWDSRPGGGPLPMRSMLPPGSVLFCELSDPEAFRAAVSDDGMAGIGARREMGFGLVAFGVWPEA